MSDRPQLPMRFKFHVVFSYASRNKDYVEAVTKALPKGIDLFDYRTTKGRAETWGHGLEKRLERIYKNSAMFCVVFVSTAYAESEWTQKEWAVLTRVARRKPGYVKPVQIDGTKMSGLEDVTWIDGSMPPEQLAAVIDEAIRDPPPKPWWFYVSWPVKVAAAALLLAAVFVVTPSRTSMSVTEVSDRAITVRVSNLGPKWSTLTASRLRFGALPLEDAELRLDKSESATIWPGFRHVHLTLLHLEPKCVPDGHRPNNEEIERMLGRHQVTLEIDVAESDDAPDRTTKRVVKIPASRLQPLVRRWVPSDATDCYGDAFLSFRRGVGRGADHRLARQRDDRGTALRRSAEGLSRQG